MNDATRTGRDADVRIIMIPASHAMSNMAAAYCDDWLVDPSDRIPELKLIEEMEIERKRADPPSELAKLNGPNNRHARRAAKARQRRR